MCVCKNTIESFPKTDKHLQCIILQNKINYFSFFRQSQASQILIEKMHTTKKEFSFLRHFIKTFREKSRRMTDHGKTMFRFVRNCQIVF